MILFAAVSFPCLILFGQKQKKTSSADEPTRNRPRGRGGGVGTIEIDDPHSKIYFWIDNASISLRATAPFSRHQLGVTRRTDSVPALSFLFSFSFGSSSFSFLFFF